MEGHHKGRQGAGERDAIIKEEEQGERWRSIIKEDKEGGVMEVHHKGRRSRGERWRAIIKEDKEQGERWRAIIKEDKEQGERWRPS